MLISVAGWLQRCADWLKRHADWIQQRAAGYYNVRTGYNGMHGERHRSHPAQGCSPRIFVQHLWKFKVGGWQYFKDMDGEKKDVMIGRAFNYTNSVETTEVHECFDCGEKLGNKQGLMAHKKEKHFKMRLCSYYHGLRTTCRFPAQHYLNIHNENNN